MAQRTTATEVDVVVIGMGVGGEHAAGELASAGLEVVAAEAELVGGECAYWACVPTKMMVRAADLLAEARRVPGMAGAAEVSPDWSPVAARIREEATDEWDDTVAADRFSGRGGRLVRGRARLTGPRRVAVGDEEFTARRGVIIATGSAPQAPPVPGLDGVPYWTNREAVAAREVPGSLLVLGGGPVGLELAQVYARFGSRVTVVEAGDRLLGREEPEAGGLLAGVLDREGIFLHLGATAVRVEHEGGTFRMELGDGQVLAADRLLVATGRRPRLAGLGLEHAGLDPTARALDTDGRMRAADGLWAVGDVTGRGPFTHVAMYQAAIAVREVLGRPGPEADYRSLPRVTFTDPEVGAAGLTERQALEQGIRVRTGITRLASATRGWIHRAGNDGFVKLVADADREVLVGATTAGPGCGELLHGLQLAIHTRIPLAELRHMIYAYPTFHRAIEAALADLGGPG
ncbi:dihydrolipoyl dehydrogenase family protein [Streptomyces aidingensis]|uniref:Pyruvate/2-oxoglutarate dehydrogenase complex, dihydrolipoamide dehydrogenase (E3) component n=1 Tax=Streptomyces aidingensis TaxID=910347 RepID=A0A1I1R3W6_9ACTN|nr:NAD(P)/FAD-dependent oxidoreductase [Streptomyces aidingensis]SFD28952.1 Pyruvate/2-oxoglutarate dehydrogenase complex, dihydrolipoamide dehydrogenase (E3) component [Streptomyces aidingensis]